MFPLTVLSSPSLLRVAPRAPGALWAPVKMAKPHSVWSVGSEETNQEVEVFHCHIFYLNIKLYMEEKKEDDINLWKKQHVSFDLFFFFIETVKY